MRKMRASYDWFEVSIHWKGGVPNQLQYGAGNTLNPTSTGA